MIDPKNKSDFKNLVEAVRESRRKMQPFREKRTDLITAFCGSEYSDDAEAKKVYLNLLAQAVNIYIRQLAVRAPTAKITTMYPDLRPLAAELSLACKEAAEEVGLGRVLRRAAEEALFSPMATVKVGLDVTRTERVGDEDVDVTEPFVSLISFDDYVRDMSARSAYEPAFEGDMYYLGKDELMEMYPNAGKIHEDDLGIQDEYGSERAESISHTQSPMTDDIKGKVAVQDVWLTKERLVVTYLVSKPDEPLAVVEFDGEEEGPYRSLWFTDVPDNAMPLPPFGLIKGIHDLANSLFRRLSSQARKKKELVGFSDEDSANRYSKAFDGDGVFWNGQKPEKLSSGGIDQPTFAFFLQVKDIFSSAAGNLDSLGGLSPMSDTAKQDELLASTASAQLADMQDAVAEFAQKVFRQIAWYEWTDPVRDRVLQKPVNGTDIVLPVLWSPETRNGDFIDFNFNIVPQSMREESPAVKIQKLQSVINQFYSPLMPMLQQQGMMIDINRLNELISDYSNLPELEQIIVPMPTSGQPQQQGPSPQGDPNPVAMPANTTRTYERVNRPGGTRYGKEAALTQTLLGGRAQQAEMDSIGRPST